MSLKLEKAHKYEKEEKQKIPAEEKPVFHVTPPIGWMNDPNGFSFYNGEIHLFYQYHPIYKRLGSHALGTLCIKRYGVLGNASGCDGAGSGI